MNLFVQNEQLRRDSAHAILEVHKLLSLRMASHLQLTFENIIRWSWLLAGTLSSKAEEAREKAREALRTLFPTPPSEFASWFKSNETLMRELQLFSDEEPPVLLWHGSGKYKELFTFVAARFCSSPDHVLDSEGIHAQWKWIETSKRAVKLKSLNAVLRLASYVHFHGDLPPFDELQPHVAEIRLFLYRQWEAVARGGEIAAGARSEWIYRNRFNLQLADAVLLKASRPRQSGGSSPEALRNLSNVLLNQDQGFAAACPLNIMLPIRCEAICVYCPAGRDY